MMMFCFAIAPVSAQERNVPADQGQVTLSFAPLVKKVAPSVVNIYTKRTVTRSYGSPFLDDPFFREFFGGNFGGGLRREQVEGALGSGVIVQPDGLVVTNAHVIKGADEIRVVLGDGREFSTKVALMDEASDLALLRMDTKGHELPFAQIGPSDNLQVGDLVLAIGNPFGVGQTVTSGIVSALARSSLNINDYNFFIQTDAAVNPGNSGGPLVAMDGHVVGINSAIFSRSGGSLGIGFAIPSEMVMAVIAAEQGGKDGNITIHRPWLGVTSQSITPEIADSLGLETPAGALISALHPASPLKKAGARVGDIIVSMNGKPIRDPGEMKFRMATVALGSDANVGLLRKGETLTVTLKTMAAPDDPPREETTLNLPPFAGITVSNINPAVASEIEGLAPDAEGVVVARMENSGMGRFMAPGDIITQVNGAAVKTVSGLKRILEKPAGMGWAIVINRHGQIQQIMIR
jgi:serine protease Do